MEVSFVQNNLDVIHRVDTDEEVLLSQSSETSESGMNGQGSRNIVNVDIIPETSSESDGNQSDDIFSSDEILPTNNGYVSESLSEGEPKGNCDHFVNFTIPESNDSQNSCEYENVDALDHSLKNVIHEVTPNDNPTENLYVSETSSGSESDAESNIFEEISIIETDVSESEAEHDTSHESNGIPLQNEQVSIPGSDLSGNDADESSEIDFCVENEITIPETPLQNGKENAIDDDLLTPTTVKTPPNQNSEISPDIFNEVSEHLNQHEDVFDESPNSKNEYTAGNAYLSEVSTDNESDNFEEVTVMETDLSESDSEDASSFESQAILVQNVSVYVPESDLSESGASEKSEEIPIPETPPENEEENYGPADDDKLLTPTSIHEPSNQESERSPDVFSEISTHSNYHEVALDNNAGSQNSFVIAQDLMTRPISPDLFDDVDVSETFSIIEETESILIPSKMLYRNASEILNNNNQDKELMSGIHQESEEIPGTPFANVTSFPFIVPRAASGKQIEL